MSSSNIEERELSDKPQIGTSELAKALMKSEKMARYFSLQQEMIKFAVCVAIKNHLEPVTDDKTMTNSHHTADLDDNASLKFLVTEYKGASAPYRLVEQLAEAGFRFIKLNLDNNRMLEDLF